MIGHSLVNFDTEKVSYDLNTSFPFVADSVLTRQHLEECIKYLDVTKQEATKFTTNQLDGLHLREMPFNEVKSLIDRAKVLYEDLVALQEIIDNPPTRAKAKK